ncbi:TetR/AcrR family transcriptional regulator [Paracoccus sp. (in: a-proteobacteria)]|uniref:TetR/AcrR family transcriptional regulator n=1 Tax=Paracoccus sp. TaxID=267 RepID=UPI003A865A0C
MKKTTLARGRGRPRLADLENRDATTELILRAALHHFSTRGFDATTTVAVAARAGIAQSVLHYHFKTKELLWQATVADLFKRANREFPLMIDTSEDADLREVLRHVIHRHMQVASVYPEIARLVIIEGSFDTERLAWLSDAYFQGTFRHFDRVLDAARARGIIGPAPNYLLTNLIYAAGAVVFSVAPMIRNSYGVDITNPVQRELAVDTGLEMLMRGLTLGTDGT